MLAAVYTHCQNVQHCLRPPNHYDEQPLQYMRKDKPLFKSGLSFAARWAFLAYSGHGYMLMAEQHVVTLSAYITE